MVRVKPDSGYVHGEFIIGESVITKLPVFGSGVTFEKYNSITDSVTEDYLYADVIVPRG